MIDMALVQTLKHVGFDEKEARVYLALLSLGQGTASEIAEGAETKRAIVYHVLDRLKRRGYVQSIRKGAVKRFAASDPSRVLQDIRAATEDLRFMLPLMRALQDKGRDRPRIEFFEGKEATLSIYRSYERGNSVRYLTSIVRLTAIIPEEVAAWVKRYEVSRKKTVVKHLLEDSEEDRVWGKKIAAVGHDVRILPKDTAIEMDFAIVDDMLGITSFDPFFIVLIHSEQTARSAGQLFDLAWNQGKTLD